MREQGIVASVGSIEKNCIHNKSCMALGVLLGNPATSLQCLLLDWNEFDDKGMEELTGGLMNNDTLKVLSLKYPHCLGCTTSIGWQTFAPYLSNPRCSMETLDLSGNEKIGDDGISSIGKAMGVNTTLKWLDLYGSKSVTSVGWHAFSTGLKISAIEELQLYQCSIGDESAFAIVSALAENPSFTSLHMNSSKTISSAGWVWCFQWLLDLKKTSLKTLSLPWIDKEGIAMLNKLHAKYLSKKNAMVLEY